MPDIVPGTQQDVLLDNLVEPPKKPSAFSAGTAAGKQGLKSIGGGLMQFAGRAIGSPALEGRGAEIVQAAAEATPPPPVTAETALDSPGNAADFVKYTVGSQLPNVAVTLLSGLVGRGLGSRLAGGTAAGKATGLGAGLVTSSVGMEAGQIFPEAVQTGVENPVGRTAAGAVVAGALDTALPALLARRFGLLGAAGGTRAPGARGVLESVAKGGAAGAVVEGGTETAQTYIERIAAGQPLEGAEAKSDLLNSGAAGLVLGALTGGLGGAFTPTARPPAPTSAQDQVVTPPAAAPVADSASVNQNVAPLEPAPVNAAFEQSTLQRDQPPELELLQAQHEAVAASVDQLDAGIADIEAQQTRRTEVLSRLKELTAESRAPERARTLREIALERKALETERDALPKPAALKDAHIEATRRRAELVPQVNDLAAQVDNFAQDVPPAVAQAAVTPELGSGARTQEQLLADTAYQRDLAELSHARQQQEDAIAEAGKRTAGVEEFRAAPTAMQEAAAVALQRASERDARVKAREDRAKAREAAAASEAQQPRVADLRSLQRVNDRAPVTPEERTRLVDTGLAAVQENGSVKLTAAGHRATQSLKRAAETTSATVKAGLEAQHNAMLAGVEAAVAIVDAKNSSALNSTPVRAARLKQRVLEGVTAAVQDAFDVPTTAAKLPDRAQVQAKLATSLAKVPGLTKDQAQEVADYVAKAVDRGPVFSHAGLTTEQLYSMSPEARNEVVDDLDNTLAVKGEALIARLKQLIGDDKHLTVDLFTAEPGSPIGSYTRTGPLKSTISLALNAADGVAVADHEGFHYLEDQLLTAHERQAVARGFAPGSRMYKALLERARVYDGVHGTQLADIIAASPVEARAYGFQFWRAGELQPQGAWAQAFAKIKEFLDKVFSYITNQGFTSVESVFDAIDRGQLADRARRSETALYVNGVEVPGDTFDSGAAQQTQTPAFKKWFGDSKVVDAQGKPLVVYHGTSDSFSEFDLGHPNRADAGWLGTGVYTTSNSGTADAYSRMKVGNSPNILPLYVRLQNPYYASQAEKNTALLIQHAKGEAAAREHADKFTKRLKAKGHDGVILEYPASKVGELNAGKEIVVFDTAAVKSAIGNRGTFDPTDPNILHSNAAADPLVTQATRDMARQIKHGELPREQIFNNVTELLDRAADRPVDLKTRASAQATAAVGAFTRARHYISTQNYIARFSNGFKGALRALDAQETFKNRLIEDGSKVWLSKWHDASQVDRDGAFNAMLQLRVSGAKAGTPEYLAVVNKLTEPQRQLLTQASGNTGMIGRFLWRQYMAESAEYQKIMTPEEWQVWADQRKQQLQGLIEGNYVPFDRFGDFTVKLVIDTPDGKPATVGYMQYESQAEAIREAKRIQDEITASGADIRVEGVGDRYVLEHDNELSFSQVLSLLQRQGISLQQEDKVKLARALLTSDSLRFQRMMRATLVPGYSRDGWRVLNRYAVRMAGQIARTEFSDHVSAALDGKPVTSALQVATDPNTGLPVEVPTFTVNSDKAANLWTADGLSAGYYRNHANRVASVVLSPVAASGWSTRLRAITMSYFLGGSLGAGAVQMMAVPMNTVPYLSQHTPYTNAWSTTLASWKDVLANPRQMQDINALRDPSVKIPALDKVPGLRAALIESIRDGTSSSTEVHQIMGISRGGILSRSKKAQTALDIWLYPFKFGEGTSRVASFISGYKIGREKGLTDTALYDFARAAVDETQNRFDPVNRPLIAHHDVGALLFMFKSFPLFMVEMIESMARSGPQGRRGATFMLLGLTAMTGTQGLPFAEDILDLIDVISQRVFNSPFNARRAMRNLFKDATEAIVGTDMSNIFLRGIINDTVGLNVATRVGNGDVLPGTRLGAADADYGRTMEQILGAPFSMVMGAGGQVGKFTGSMLKGDFDGVMSAIRAGGPTALRNLVKGYEQLDQGFAQDARGNKIVDIESPYALFQAIGIAPAALTKAYDADSITRAEKAFYTQVRSDFTLQMTKALKDGNSDKLREIFDSLTQWNEANPEMPIMLSPATIRRNLVLSGLPLNERTVMLLPRQLRGTSIADQGG